MKFWNGSSFKPTAFIPAAVALFACTVAFAQTFTFELKNGDRVTGRIISEKTNTLILSNAWARELTLPLAEISKRFPNTNGVVASTASATNKPATNAVALAKVVAATNALFTSPLLKHWHGEIHVGADLTFSERDRQVFNAKSKLLYAKDRLKAVLDYDMTYGRSEVEERVGTGTNAHRRTVTRPDANRMNGSVKVDYDLTKKIYVYNLGAAGYDEIRKIDLRYEIGPGVGYHLIQRTNFFVNVEAGVNYQHEEHTDGETINTFFYRFGENAAWKITPRLTWDERLEYTPRVGELEFYRVRFETNLRYAMLQNVFVNLSIVDIYDSDPARGVSRNDLQIRSSVGVKF
jgi:putative salt-induced outer membrane protein YdiY